MQDCGGGIGKAMLMTSAVAMLFSCSGATGFSEFEFDFGSSIAFETETRTGFPIGRLKPSNVMSRYSLEGAELSILRLFPVSGHSQNEACAEPCNFWESPHPWPRNHSLTASLSAFPKRDGHTFGDTILPAGKFQLEWSTETLEIL